MMDDASLSVTLRGAEGPPVVLLHGLVASGLYWDRVVERLAGGSRVVVPDLVGFGRSARPPTGYGADDHVDALVAALDRLDVVEPVLVGAHSMGSVVAVRLAVRQPGRVIGVVAFGPPLHTDRAAATARVRGTGPMGRLLVLPGRLAEEACRWVCEHRDLAGRISVLTHPRLPPAIAADGVRHSWPSYSQSLEALILRAEGSGWLDEVSCPVHLVAGRSDPVIDRTHLRLLEARLDHVRVHEWDGGHDLPLRRPDECARLLTRVLHGASPPGA